MKIINKLIFIYFDYWKNQVVLLEFDFEFQFMIK
jgi:hypothetical protein